MHSTEGVSLFLHNLIQSPLNTLLLSQCTSYLSKMEVAEILKLGAQYGLDGKLLADFLRDERAAARQKEKDEREHKAKEDLLKIEHDEAEARRHERQRERDEREKEREEHDKIREERQRERAHELEVLRLQQAAGTIENQDQDNRRQDATKSIKPKIPPFDESKEDIDAYLHRFERYATAQKWDKESWGTSLSALLKGESLNTYYRVPKEEQDNYDAIKKALLKRYRLTEKGFREKFRKAVPEYGETFSQFIVRLDMYLQRWIELSEIEQDFQGLKDLLLREQALNVATKDLQVFLQERKPANAQEMGVIAEQYLEVHGKLYDAWQAQSKSSKHQPDKKGKFSKSEDKADTKPEAKGATHEADKVKKTCFLCHRTGHYVKDCTFKKKKDNVAAMQAVIDEPELVTLENGWKVPVTVKDGIKYVKTKEGNMECALSLEKQINVPQVVGELVGHGLVNVVRDTGCTGVIVKKDLCPKGCFTNDNGSCTMVDGSVKVAPIVVVELDTPFYKGKVRAMAMSSPIFDVIIGNISGARDASNPDFKWKPKDEECVVVGNSSQVREEESAENCSPRRETGMFADVVNTSSHAEHGESSKLIVSSHQEHGELSSHKEHGEFSSHLRNGELIVSSHQEHGESSSHLRNGESSKLSSHCNENNDESCKLSSVVSENSQAKVGYKTRVDDGVISTEIQSDTVISAGVVTRAMSKVRGLKPLIVAQPELVRVDRKQLIDLQRQDHSLDKVRALVGNPVVQSRSWQERYFLDDHVLYREHTSSEKTGQRVTIQLVLPKLLREGVMEVAHDAILGGHLGTQKTVDRVQANFYWPGINGDIKRFCASCDKCQRTAPRGRTRRVPLGSTPIIDTPFTRVAVDLVGPLPVSNSGFRYILTLVDFATRYPEAVALKRIETVDVAEALVTIFSRVGLPREILHDQGAQFTGGLMEEIARLLSIKKLSTTPYHAMANGLVEKFNGVLKSMLKRMCEERPKDWDRYLPAVLFAYREVPQDSLGFSPFEMLYGRSVRGPMMLLRELWTGKDVDDDVKSTYQYVLELRERLEETCALAQDSLRKAKCRQKSYYDKKAQNRTFKAGDQVLLLLPTDNNKLIMQWKGPFDVLDRVAHNDYRIDVNGKEKIFHANMLKLYICREQDEDNIVATQALVTVQDEEEEQGAARDLMFCPIESTETWRDVKVNEKLDQVKSEEVWTLIEEFNSVFTDFPGKTDLLECHIDLVDDTPVRQRQYPVPFAIRESMRNEVEKMEKMGVIEESQSEYCSPSVIVRKPDSSHRYCIDFRRVNAISVLDSEPIPNQEAIIAKLGKCKYFTKIDLSKGFWQIPITAKDRHKTAFATERGLRQFVVMPFGLVNASSIFCRMMRKLLDGVENAESYIDDLIVFSDTWEKQIATLREIFTRLKRHRLTARPTKCLVGFSEIDFLGQKVGKGVVKPQKEKIRKILEIERPKTKKELRSLIGMISYQRKFVPLFADKAKPLTDMLGKGYPNKLKWNDDAENSFQTFKTILSSPPVLHLPKLEKTMILAVDSSGTGIGGVLMQEHEGHYAPLMYISRKLKPAETRYSAIERECLALVWAIKTLHSFLYGKEFILMSDHQPLKYLNSAKMNNSRVMRWALDLQVYRFVVKVIKGSENFVADYLSRCGSE